MKIANYLLINGRRTKVNAEIVDKLPEVNYENILKVEEMTKDSESASFEASEYNYYKVTELSFRDREQYEWEMKNGEDVDEYTYADEKYIAILPDVILENELLPRWDTIASYMDDEIREDIHQELAPCSEVEFFREYMERDPEFIDLLRSEFPKVAEVWYSL